MPQLTKEQMQYFLDDEWKAYQEYKRLGLNDLANDELRHYNFFKKMLEKK